jgi:hypothetical protein
MLDFTIHLASRDTPDALQPMFSLSQTHPATAPQKQGV